MVITLGFFIFYLKCGHLFQLALSQNTNKVVYSSLELKSISLQNREHITKVVLAKCAQLKITKRGELKPKKTRRTKRGGRRKRRFIQVQVSQFNENSFKPFLGPFKKKHVSSVVNKGNLIQIDCRNVFQEDSINMRVGCFNVRSCTHKTEFISDIIEESNIDILCITETWLHEFGDEPILSQLTPHGYDIKSSPRLGRRGGGIAFVYRNEISIATPPNDHKTFESFEIAYFTFLASSYKTLIACIYRPPRSKSNKITSANFIAELQELFSYIASKSAHFIITGDFNVHFDSNASTETRNIKDLLSEYDLTQMVTVPTHRSNHILDWVVAPSGNSNIQGINVIDKTISDHFLVLIEMNLQKQKKRLKTVCTRDMRHLNTDDFKRDLRIAMPPIYSTSIDNVNTALEATLDIHAPRTTRRISHRQPAPWFSISIKEARQTRRRAERRWRKTGLHIHKDIFITHRNIVTDLVRTLKRNYFVNKFGCVKSCKELFVLADHLLGREKKPILPQGNTKDLCKKFSFFFQNKIASIRGNLDNSSYPPLILHQYDGPPLTSFDEVSESVVSDLILKSPSKFCALDPVPTSMLKECLPETLSSIVKIVNDSLRSGVVPDCFKRAIVNPLLKKTGLDESELKNYRPVSNLPFLSKILEKVVLKQLLCHFERNKLGEIFQSAYKASHSTETAILRVTNDILVKLDTGKLCVLVLLDLSAAFDTIDHSILLKRLEMTFGIHGTALDWFESYLSNRLQVVKVGEHFSESTSLLFGVPQGSVLGPILFTLYTQPLVDILRKHDMMYHFYADDTQLYKAGSHEDLQNMMTSVEMCVSEIKQWMTGHKLKLNDDKTEIMIINRHTIPAQHLPSVTINGHPIKLASKVKNLGVILDSELSMAPHISGLCKSLNFQLRKIGNIRPFLPKEVTTKLITSLILSKIDYCNSLLVGLPQNKIRKIQMIQNNAARLIMKRKKTENITPILRELHWLPIEKRIIFKVATMSFKCINNSAPQYLTDLLQVYHPSRALRSSRDNKLVKPRVKSKTFGERAFFHSGPAVWNSIPRPIRQMTSLTQFLKSLKTYLFNS